MSRYQGQPRLLHVLWLAFSPAYRTWNSARRGEKEISRTEREHGVTRQQALAIISDGMDPKLRGLLRSYRSAA